MFRLTQRYALEREVQASALASGHWSPWAPREGVSSRAYASVILLPEGCRQLKGLQRVSEREDVRVEGGR